MLRYATDECHILSVKQKFTQFYNYLSTILL